MKRFLGLVIGSLARAVTRSSLGRRTVSELESRLGLTYWVDRLRHEDARISRFLRGKPKSSNGTISVIATSYGIPLRYVREFVRSIERQTYPSWELCICDDGDTIPEVSAYWQRLARRHPDRVRLHRHATNLGISPGTRTALSLARGQVLAFADVDDTLHPRALETIARVCASDPSIDVVYTNHDMMTDWGHRLMPVRKPAWSPELLLTTNYINHLVAVRRSCLEACTGAFADDQSGSQDWDLLLRASRIARRVSHVPLVLYHWRKRPGSVAACIEAKPWATRAAVRVSRAHIEAIDQRLTLDALGMGPRVKREYPRIVVLQCGSGRRSAGPTPPLNYRGALRVIPITVDCGDLARAASHIDVTIAKEVGSAELVLFVLEDAPALCGDLAGMAAFALLPGVGCVWPFRRNVRCVYSLSRDGTALEQVRSHRSSFSSFSGNVLTGPLHGLMTATRVWQHMGGLGACLSEPRCADGEPNALGAMFGLAQFRSKRRNVAVRSVSCDIELPAIALDAPIAVSDPYP